MPKYIMECTTKIIISTEDFNIMYKNIKKIYEILYELNCLCDYNQSFRDLFSKGVKNERTINFKISK